MKLNEVYPLDNIERLILLRRQLNMTQFQFAKEIGISPSTLSQIERGVSLLNENVLNKIKIYSPINIYEVNPTNSVERLFLIRIRLKLSQEQFAKEIGVSTSYLGQIERGEYIMTNSFLEKLEDFLQKETHKL
ncbi:helix-turn-helix transcriptional regulator [Caldifermentibacillus hisashii]|uniref:helix-turn-helix domain-containing protein n=1 Tax=Caldifermentibacillus hisashii TaxID=996558 RepID=UPI0022B9996C|nr:helix-turn-helix transcriptional regulator [Caldifermentibacillus hisashii]